MGVDVGLLGAEAGRELQAVAEKRGVGAEVTRGDDLLHAVRVVGLVGVVGAGVAGPVIGVGAVALPELAVVHVLLLGEAEVGDARRVNRVQERDGTVVVDQAGLGRGRSAGAAIRAHVVVEFTRGAPAVAEHGAEIDAGLQRDRDIAHDEIAADVAEGLAAGLVSLLPDAVGRDDRVAFEVGWIDFVAGGIGHREAAGAEIENVVKADRHVGAAPDETVKSPVIDVLVYDARSGVGDAGF